MTGKVQCPTVESREQTATVYWSTQTQHIVNYTERKYGMAVTRHDVVNGVVEQSSQKDCVMQQECYSEMKTVLLELHPNDYIQT